MAKNLISSNLAPGNLLIFGEEQLKNTLFVFIKYKIITQRKSENLI